MVAVEYKYKSLKGLSHEMDFKNFDLEETNFNKLMVKIRGMSLFWAKFKLSIVGRINIAKTVQNDLLKRDLTSHTLSMDIQPPMCFAPRPV